MVNIQLENFFYFYNLFFDSSRQLQCELVNQRLKLAQEMLGKAAKISQNCGAKSGEINWKIPMPYFGCKKRVKFVIKTSSLRINNESKKLNLSGDRKTLRNFSLSLISIYV